MKFRAFEFEDQPWFPGYIRDSMTDYLRFLFRMLKLYYPVLPVLKDALTKSNTNKIIDLCSGSGGTIEIIYENLKQTFDPETQITLSDFYPSESAYELLSKLTNGGITYVSNSVDACYVPSGLKGLRTIFSAFHHFDREKVSQVLKNAVDSEQGIAIFDGGNRSLWMVLLIVIAHPVLMFLFTPFIRPFRTLRVVFTYLFPIIPFCVIWDGIISIQRLYSPDEMLQIAKETDNHGYIWNSGRIKSKFGLSIAYLTGYPKKRKAEVLLKSELPL